MSKKEKEEQEQSFAGCYGEQVKPSQLIGFLEDSFQANLDNEASGSEERFATCIWGHAGLGKCVAGDTLITLDTGICRIDGLFDGPKSDSEYPVEGMRVHTPAAKEPMKEVGYLYFSGIKPSIGIRTDHGRELVGSLVHPVKILREKGFDFIPMSDVKIGDMVVVDWIRSDRPDIALPPVGAGHRNLKLDFSIPEKMNTDLAFILGALVGEGNKCSYGSVVFCQERTKSLAVEYVKTARKVFGLECSEELDDRTENTCNYRIHRKALRGWLADIGLNYVDSHGASVPASVLQSSKKSQLSFIRAIYEAEGDSTGGICLSSVSKRLLQEVQVMLLQFDVSASLHPKDSSQTSWRLMSCGKNARKLQKLIGFSRVDPSADWLKDTKKDQSNKGGVPSEWAYSFLRNMKDSHLENGGVLTKKAIHSYPLNNIYGRSVAVNRRDSKRQRWTIDKVCSIASMLNRADESFKAEMEYVLSFQYEPIVGIWDNGEIPLYDLNVPDGHEFDANGIVVHNTAIVKQQAKKPVVWNGKTYDGYKVHDVPIAQFEEMGDLHGMPSRHLLMRKENGKSGAVVERWIPEEVIQGYLSDGWVVDHTVGIRTMYAPPDWVPTEAGPSILLLDDWNRASVRIIKGIMQLLQNYGMVSWKLPPGCNIVLTGNPDEQDYLVTSIDSAILTRIRSITLKDDAKEWSVWAQSQKLDPRLINYCLRYPEMMIGQERTNPRTLSEFGRCCKRIPDLKDKDNQMRFKMLASSLLDEQTVSSMMVFFERDVEMIIEPEAILAGADWINKHIKKLMSGAEKRVDVLGVTCDRLFAYIVQPNCPQDKKSIKNFQDFLCLDDIPEDLRHNLCLRVARVRDAAGKMSSWIMYNDKLKKMILEVV